MDYKVVETEAALQDLRRILEYISIVLANPSAASDFADKVDECYIELAHAPFIYESCRDWHLYEKGYHKAVIKNYVLIYRIDEAEHCVYILRFFYNRQDYMKML